VLALPVVALPALLLFVTVASPDVAAPVTPLFTVVVLSLLVVEELPLGSLLVGALVVSVGSLLELSGVSVGVVACVPELVSDVEVVVSVVAGFCAAVEPVALEVTVGSLPLSVVWVVVLEGSLDELSLNANVLAGCILAASNNPPMIAPVTRCFFVVFIIVYIP
jgi:hypothetical protein